MEMARLMRIIQIEAREGRQDDQEIDFWFGEGPAVRDCGVNARTRREYLAGDLGTSRRTGVSVIVSDFDLGLFF
jgi:hypothetical protein